MNTNPMEQKINITSGFYKKEIVHTSKRAYLKVYCYPYPNSTDVKIEFYSYMLSEDECVAKGCGCIAEQHANADLIVTTFNSAQNAKPQNNQL